MTESQTTPEPARPPHTDAPTPPLPPLPAEQAAALGGPAPAAHTAPHTPAVLDEGTFTQIREPRNEGRLPLDGDWHQISPKYVISQTVQNAIFVAIVVVAMLVVGLVLEQHWVWWPGGVVLAITIVTQIVLPRQARALGYMLREDDIVFRKGILWQRVVAVPYGRMQLVDITHGPMDRAFGIAKLKMVTAAATTGVEIPGLSQPAAEALRDTLIQVAETRRTGL
ncbi:PH domain-containing protein [Microbacterium sediminis]|uniref:PH domain-containing protein n=1 Tax=Microbacterium sediminis TaxID=904291 RepID=UPI000A04F6F9|nr:hypothetical protein E3O41_01925 [Microbacterium sediminis]